MLPALLRVSSCWKAKSKSALRAYSLLTEIFIFYPTDSNPLSRSIVLDALMGRAVRSAMAAARYYKDYYVTSAERKRFVETTFWNRRHSRCCWNATFGCENGARSRGSAGDVGPPGCGTANGRYSPRSTDRNGYTGERPLAGGASGRRIEPCPRRSALCRDHDHARSCLSDPYRSICG